MTARIQALEAMEQQQSQQLKARSEAVVTEQQKTAQLTARIRVLEAMEQQQSQQLKAQSENAHLIQQVNQVARGTTNQVFRGPDIVEHFKAF